MKTLEIEYPESIPAVLNISPEIFEQEAKVAMAVKLYELGRLSSGQAARLAGVTRVSFLLDCHRFGAALQKMQDRGYWIMDVPELQFDAMFADFVDQGNPCVMQV
ncbi:MAG: UPF0175 family protein [Pseudomonadota bacterium]